MTANFWIGLVLAFATTPAPALQCLVDASRTQIGVTLSYDPSYVRLDYPGGDVPLERGVCTDVLIRAYRAIGVDLRAVLAATGKCFMTTTQFRVHDRRNVSCGKPR